MKSVSRTSINDKSNVVGSQVAEDPAGDPLHHRRLANRQINADDQSSGEASLMRALVLEPSDGFAMRLFAGMWRGLADRERCIRTLSWARVREPGDPAIGSILGRMLFETGRIDESERILQTAVRENDDVGLLRSLAGLLNRQDRVKEAVATLEAAVTSCNDAEQLAKVYIELSRLLTRLDRLDDAARYVSSGLTMRPGDARGVCDLAELNRRREFAGDLDPQYAQAVCAFDPKGGDLEILVSIHEFRGEYLLKQGRADEAALVLTSAPATEGDVARFEILRATAHLAAGQFDPALDALRTATASGNSGVVVSAMSSRELIRTDPNAYCRERGLPIEHFGQTECHRVTTQSRAFPVVEYELPPPFLARLRDVTVIPRQYSIVTEDNCFLIDQLTYNAESAASRCEDTIAYVSNGRRMAALLPSEIEQDQNTAVLLGGGVNFYHCLFDWLSRLCVIEGRTDLEFLPVIVSPNMPTTIVDALERLGVPRDRFRKLGDRTTRFREIWAPSLTHTKFGMVSPRHLQFLERVLFAQFRDRESRGRRRLFVTRRSTHHRRLLNEEEIWHILERLGFELVEPQNLSFQAQLETFADAETVVGTFGAGLWGMLAAPRQTKLVELTHPRAAHPMYPVLCALLGQEYRLVLGEPEVAYGTPLMHADFQVNPQELRRALSDADATSVIVG